MLFFPALVLVVGTDFSLFSNNHISVLKGKKVFCASLQNIQNMFQTDLINISRIHTIEFSLHMFCTGYNSQYYTFHYAANSLNSANSENLKDH